MPDSSKKLKQLLNRVEETLVANIPATIRRLGLAERAYCIFIVFHDTTVFEDFRPNLVVASERLRCKLFETELNAADIVWNPSLLDVHEVSPGSVCEGTNLQQECREIYRILIDDGRDEEDLLSPIRATMRRVAKRLNQFSWSQFLDTTDDFVVVAIDDMGFDPYSDIQACVEPERIALLDSRGLLANRTAKCPQCGKDLRTPQAKQCFLCGANWHQ